MCSSQVPDTWLEEEGLLLTGLKVQHGCIAIEGRAWSTGFSSVCDRRCKENSKEESKTTHSRQGHSPRHIIPLPSESQAHSTCLWKSIRSQTLTALPRSLPPVVPASVFLILLPRLYAWPETRPRLSSVKILGSFYVTCNPGNSTQSPAPPTSPASQLLPLWPPQPPSSFPSHTSFASHHVHSQPTCFVPVPCQVSILSSLVLFLLLKIPHPLFVWLASSS